MRSYRTHLLACFLHLLEQRPISAVGLPRAQAAVNAILKSICKYGVGCDKNKKSNSLKADHDKVVVEKIMCDASQRDPLLVIDDLV